MVAAADAVAVAVVGDDGDASSAAADSGDECCVRYATGPPDARSASLR